VDDGKQDVAAVVDDGGGMDLHRADIAAGQAVGKHEVIARLGHGALAFRAYLIGRQGVDVADASPGQLRPVVSVEAAGSGIGVQDAAAVGLDQQHDGIVMLKQILETALVLPRCPFADSAFRHVQAEATDFHQAARGVEHTHVAPREPAGPFRGRHLPFGAVVAMVALKPRQNVPDMTLRAVPEEPGQDIRQSSTDQGGYLQSECLGAAPIGVTHHPVRPPAQDHFPE
jgi:hypothetical protein